MTLLFFDTETSGIYKFKEPVDSPNQPYLVQLACILDDDDGETVLEYETIVRVGDVNIPASAAEIHGITTAIANEKGISSQLALVKFEEMLRRTDTLVAHNINFDVNIMLAAATRAGTKTSVKSKPNYCTMQESTSLLKLPGRYGKYKWPKLDEAYRVLVDIEGFEGAHDALNDVRACRKVYYALRKVGR